jgi:putative transposase
VFLTQNTADRKAYLQSEVNVKLFWETLRRTNEHHPLHLLAYVILPDHFHFLMKVDNEACNFSQVMHSIKRNYTLEFKKKNGINSSFHLWQPRFWDHIIRNEKDLVNHFDYIHWNPVKHGMVTKPIEWSHSSLNFWVKRGYYEPEWGWNEESNNIMEMNLH